MKKFVFTKKRRLALAKARRKWKSMSKTSRKRSGTKRQTKRGRAQDRKIRAKYRPRKKFKKGLGHKGDWARKKYRK
jgi:hypothetical protein